MNPLTILLVIAAYFALLFFISYLAGRKADNAGFFSGNRSSNWLLVAMSTIGAAISGVTFVSVPGMVATSGWAYMQMVLGFTAMLCRATKTDGSWWRVLTKCGPLEKGMANHFSILALRPHEQNEKQKDKTLKDEFPRSVGGQYASGDEWRNNSRKNEETEPKQKQHPVVDVTGYGHKVQCCKDQYCIGTWNVRSMNQGKLEKWSNRRWQE